MNIIEKLKCRSIVPRAALYARFSSDNQREESIEAQLRAMHDFCEKSGITVVREFCDHTKSATTNDQPEFQNMIDSAKGGDFDLAIVHKLDRFSRNRYDSAYLQAGVKKVRRHADERAGKSGRQPGEHHSRVGAGGAWTTVNKADKKIKTKRT